MRREALVLALICAAGWGITAALGEALGWAPRALLGKSHAQVVTQIGPPTCRQMDRDTWFVGVTLGDWQGMGLALDVT